MNAAAGGCSPVADETLRWARGNGCPSKRRTCAHAEVRLAPDACGGSFVAGCPWDENTTANAAARPPNSCGGAAKRRAPVDRADELARAAGGRPPRDAEVGHRARMPVRRRDVSARGAGRPPRDVKVAAADADGSDAGDRAPALGDAGRERDPPRRRVVPGERLSLEHFARVRSTPCTAFCATAEGAFSLSAAASPAVRGVPEKNSIN